MIKSKGRRITWFVLTLILAMGMIGTSVLAADANSENSINKAFTEDNTMTNKDIDSTTAERMANSNNVGNVTIHKQFDKIDGKWPTDMTFKYNFERVKWWDNSNVSTQENGTWKAGELGTMPLPNTQDADVAPGANDNTVVVSVLTKADGEVALGSVLKKLNFTRPGYYVYKVVEQYPVEKNPLGGVKYDEHVYYLAFYVANRTADAEYLEVTKAKALENPDGFYYKTRSGEAGNYKYTDRVTGETALKALADDVVLYKAQYDESGKTIGGGQAVESDNIYVHTITAWRGNAIRGTNPNGTEFSDELPQLISPADVDPSFNNASGDKEVQDNNKENVEKVGRSTPDRPNCIEIKFWNETDSKDISLEKVVKGTLGDVQKEFEFTVVITGAEANADYVVTGNTSKIQEATVGKTTLIAEVKDPETGTVTQPASAKFTTQADGNCTFVVKLKANEKINIEGLPTGAKYQVTEAASDHKPSYKIEGAGTFKYTKTTEEPAEGQKVYYYDTDKWIGVDALADVPEGKDAYKREKQGPVIATATDSKDGKNNALATEVQTVDPTDGAVSIVYTNTRDFETETGIPNFVFPVVLAAMIALIGLAVVRRRKDVASVNDFEF